MYIISYTVTFEINYKYKFKGVKYKFKGVKYKFTNLPLPLKIYK